MGNSCIAEYSQALVQDLLRDKRELEGWLDKSREQLRQSEHKLTEAQADLRK
jgi:hypothetical protein